ncbi:histidine kinase [Herbiconiux sp. CPCC 203407]|uniref:histidine kinase n=1 Tax=Herbiconiux oxytropis TaxID=2970915 RepID=A0AA41XI52_9MICO|nr:histidine kinase [Herbiconiux oxytropis]MCS5721933.1 histidine kinase [Herbiconiux oxytropis]MCS5725516.1 histidine kinase [Herbiconiux oxytropis]
MLRSVQPWQWGLDLGIGIACVLLWLVLGGLPPAGVVAVLLLGAVLALRRVSPALALAIAWAATGLQMAASLPPDVADLAVLPMLYATARYGGRVVKWAGLASAVVGALVAGAYLAFGPALRQPGAPAPEGAQLSVIFLIYTASIAGLLALSWTLGLLAKTWATARESRLRQATAERETRVQQQRTRIARDMHDVVAHSLAVVIAQADGARYAGRADPAAAEAALVTISSTAREALSEVRVLLAQLRDDDERGPQPTLAELPTLFSQLTDAGLPVRVEEYGASVALPPGQQLAVYRVLQEALVNALRHGDRQAAGVRIDWGAAELSVSVSNGLGAAAPTPAPDAPGYGITGMRERVQLAGGRLTSGREDGRFVVRFAVPIDRADAPQALGEEKAS